MASHGSFMNELLRCAPCEESRCCPCSRPSSAPEAKRSLTVGFALLFIALLFGCIGYALPGLLETTLQDGLAETQILNSPDALAYKNFSDNSDYPIKMSVYFMDLKNPQGVLDGEKPKLEEVGPFVYNMFRKAFDVEWNDQQTEISFKYQDNFVFIPEESVGDENAISITTARISFWGLVTFFRKNTNISNILKENPHFTEVDQVYTTKTVKEHLFGYDDEFLQLFNPEAIPHRFDGFMPIYPTVEKAREHVKADTFGTGFPNIRDLRQMKKFLGQDTITAKHPAGFIFNPWPKKETNVIVGSDGGNFPTPVQSTDSLQHFSGTMFRNVPLEFVEKRIHKEIDVLRFKYPDTLWQNEETYPPNADYLQNGPNGLLPLASCLYVDAYTSMPRFHGADKEVHEAIDIAWKDESNPDFTTYFDIESRTGATFNLYMSSQLNIQLKPTLLLEEGDYEGADPEPAEYYSGIKSHHIPVFWASQVAGINDKDAGDFAAAVNFIEGAKSDGPIVAFTIGLVALLCGVLILIRSNIYKKQFEHAQHVYIDTDNVDDSYRGQETRAGHLEPIGLTGPGDYGSFSHDAPSQPVPSTYNANVNYKQVPSNESSLDNLVPRNMVPSEYQAEVYVAAPPSP